MNLTNKQSEYIRNATHRYNFKVGARRCGKSYIDTVYVIPTNVIELKGKDGLNVILGVTNNTIERNVLQPMRQVYGPDLISRINSQNIARIFGEEVYCLGAEKVSQVSKIQGSSIKFLYCDELARFNKEVFAMVQGSLDKEYSICHGALNPEHNNHWLKVEFLDNIESKGLDVYVQHYTIFDNPFLPKKFVENLCKEYQGTVFYDRLIMGEWKNAEGLIHKNFANNPSEWLLEQPPERIPMKVTIGNDVGGNGSKTTFVATAIFGRYDEAVVFDEEVVDGEEVDFAKVYASLDRLYTRIQSVYPQRIHMYIDNEAQMYINTIRAYCRQQGYNIQVDNCYKGKIFDRIMTISLLLGSYRMKITKNCRNVINSLSQQRYSEKKPDEREDSGSDITIDIADAHEYSISSFMEQLARGRK